MQVVEGSCCSMRQKRHARIQEALNKKMFVPFALILQAPRLFTSPTNEKEIKDLLSVQIYLLLTQSRRKFNWRTETKINWLVQFLYMKEAVFNMW